MTTENTTANEDQDFGTPSADGGSGFTNFKEMYHEIPQGTSIWQIAPGSKGLKQTGRWFQFWALHWGYRTIRAKDDKEVARPFVCVLKKDFQSGKVEQDCPACGVIQKLKDQKEAEEVRLKALGKSKDEIKLAVKPISEKLGLKGFKLDMKYYCIARNAAGKWAILRLGSKAKKAIDAKIRAVAKDGGNLLDPNACVWWEIERSGEGFDTEYKVSLAREWSEVTKGPETKKSALSQTDREAIRKLPDLTKVNEKSVLTPDQVKAIVDSGGDPTIVTKIFGGSQAQSNGDEHDGDDEGTTTQTTAASSNPAPVAPTGPAQILPGMSQREMLLNSGIDPAVLDQFFKNSESAK